MVDPTVIGYLSTFIAAIISTAGGAAFAYACAVTKQLREEKKLSQRHKEITDRALCLLLRGQLIDDAERLLSDGWAGITKRTNWEQVYQMYEELCTISGTKNHVIEDLADSIASLPTSKTIPKEDEDNG